MNIPQMTKIQAHFENSNLELNLTKDADGHYLDEVARYAWMNWMAAYSFGREHQANIANKAIEIALAEQQAQKALESLPENLILPESKAALGDWIDSEQETCIKQAQPEPVDPHAALRAEYAKQVKEGTTGFYLWEFQSDGFPKKTPTHYAPEFRAHAKYFCTDISCMVAKQGEPAKRMLRTEAQALQRSLGDAVEWLTPYKSNLKGWEVFAFSEQGTYTYAPKALKQVSWTGIREDVIALLKEFGLLKEGAA